MLRLYYKLKFLCLLNFLFVNFLRLKNLQVGYSLPKRVLDGQNVLNGVKVTFTGRNILTATKYSGIDPEVDSNLSLGRLGNSKQFLFGLELTF